MTLATALHAAALAGGLFALFSGVAFFLAGILPGDSAAWWLQYGWAAIALTAAYYLLTFALDAWLSC